MQKIYLTDASDHNRLMEVDEIVEGCLVNLVAPSATELQSVATRLGIDLDDLQAPLDEEERSRFSEEDNYALIIVDIPILEANDVVENYTTIPFGIITTPEAIVTTCLVETPLINDFLSGQIRNFRTAKKTRFILQFLLGTATLYLRYLRAIDTRSEATERALHHSMRNNELISMLGLEKSLVYFSTSLRANQRVLERLLRSQAIIQYPDDEDLLEDVIEENKQAIEMADIYSSILSGTMDAYASVIANNQSSVMKILALITIILSIPTMIFSAYGMNVAGAGMPLSESYWGFAIIIGIALAISVLAGVVFFIKKWF